MPDSDRIAATLVPVRYPKHVCRCGRPCEDYRFKTCNSCRRSSRVSKRRTVERRMAEGICVQCGEADAVEGIQRCQPCREDNCAHVHMNREVANAELLCERCLTRPKAKGYMTCDPCRRRNNELYAAKVGRRKEQVSG